MKNPAIAIFVKTPGLSPIKTRLAASIGKEAAEMLYTFSIKAIQMTLKNVKATPYWVLKEENGIFSPLWNKFECLHSREKGLGAQQHDIYQKLIKRHPYVFFTGGDVPQLSTTLINKALTLIRLHPYIIGPSFDGGYYLFGGSQTIYKNIWTAVTYSTRNTANELSELLTEKPFFLERMSDMDTLFDLKFIRHQIENLPKKDLNVYHKKIAYWVDQHVHLNEQNIVPFPAHKTSSKMHV